MSQSIIEVQDLHKIFRSGGFLVRKSETHAVDGVSLEITKGTSLGLVGESGSGKTTIGRMVAGLITPTSGRVLFRGDDISGMSRTEQLQYRRRVQIIFQNSQNVFNPRRTIRSTLSDAFQIHGLGKGEARGHRLDELMELVGLPRSMLDRYPHQMSGGQRQRIGVAKALSLGPEMLVADEPVSALDVSVQAQVLNLFAELIDELSLSLLFISHDIRAVYFLCERIAVLYLGQLVEVAPRQQLLESPTQPYTQALIGSVPVFAPGEGFNRTVLRGEIQDTGNSDGCAFAVRCPVRAALGNPAACAEERPELAEVDEEHVAACHFAQESREMYTSPITIGGV